MLPRSEHKDSRMQCDPLYFRYTSWLFCNPEPPWGPGNSMLHICFLIGFSGRNSIRYTSVILFTALWDPRGPRITPAFGLWPCKFNPLYFRYTFHCALGSTWAANHLVILSAQLNWNTSATELAQNKKQLRKWRSIVLAILTIDVLYCPTCPIM